MSLISPLPSFVRTLVYEKVAGRNVTSMSFDTSATLTVCLPISDKVTVPLSSIDSPGSSVFTPLDSTRTGSPEVARPLSLSKSP